MTPETQSGGAREESRWRSQVNAIIETQIARSPFLVQSRAVWRQLDHERENWPLLLPLVLLVFAAVYLRERRKVFAVQRALEE
jgi:hypothetical protein